MPFPGGTTPAFDPTGLRAGMDAPGVVGVLVLGSVALCKLRNEGDVTVDEGRGASARWKE